MEPTDLVLVYTWRAGDIAKMYNKYYEDPERYEWTTPWGALTLKQQRYICDYVKHSINSHIEDGLNWDTLMDCSITFMPED